MYRTLFLIGILSVFALPTILFAQLDDTSLVSDVTISAFPQNPEPLQPVLLEVVSYSIDLTQATVVWRYNGKVVASGIGKTKISIVAPNSGEAGLVTATTSGAGFGSSTTAFDLRTAKVDLLWEAADSYTPPFYKGKAMLSTNGLVRVTAIPTYTAPKNVSFEWSRNDSAAPDASGYKRDSFIFRNETLKQRERISVNAQSGLYTGTNTISVTPQKPELVVYKKQEGFIDYANGSISGVVTKDRGITLRFEPYFFSVQHNDLQKDLIFEIKNNENSLTSNGKPNEISLSRPDNGGQSAIAVEINTVIYSLQNMLREFTILFK